MQSTRSTVFFFNQQLSIPQIFEKVLVQNILFGLSPSFTNSLQLIPRWRFVVAAFPHVMHCAAAMLQHRSAAFPSRPRTLPLTLRLFFLLQEGVELQPWDGRDQASLHPPLGHSRCRRRVLITGIVIEFETSPCTKKVEMTSHSIYFARLNLTASWRRQHSPTCFHSPPSR